MKDIQQDQMRNYNIRIKGVYSQLNQKMQNTHYEYNTPISLRQNFNIQSDHINIILFKINFITDLKCSLGFIIPQIDLVQNIKLSENIVFSMTYKKIVLTKQQIIDIYKYNQIVFSILNNFSLTNYQQHFFSLESQESKNYLIVPIGEEKIDFEHIDKTLKQKDQDFLDQNKFQTLNDQSFIVYSNKKYYVTLLYIKDDYFCSEYLIQKLNKNKSINLKIDLKDLVNYIQNSYDKNRQLFFSQNQARNVVRHSFLVFELLDIKLIDNQEKNSQIIINNLEQFKIIHSIDQTLLTFTQFEHYLQLQHIFPQIERTFFAMEMQHVFRMKIDFQNLIQCTQTSQYSLKNNYESFETLGDSVLKFIVTIQLLQNKIALNRISFEKSTRVNNKYLSILATMNEIQYFVQHNQTKPQDWSPPFLPEKRKQQNILMMKNLADILESLIGCIFMMNFKFDDVVDFLKQLNFPLSFENNDFFFNPDQKYDLLFTLNDHISEKISFNDLFQKSPIYENKLKRQCKKEELQQILQYKFKQQSILANVLDHDYGLSVAGNAILEIVLVANFFYFCKNRDPVVSSKFKQCLLSNNFIQKIGIKLGIQTFFNNPQDINAIQTYEQEIKDKNIFQNQFRDFFLLKNNLNVFNKFWDCVMGGVLYDGGIVQLKKLINQVYGPFFTYFIKSNFQLGSTMNFLKTTLIYYFNYKNTKKNRYFFNIQNQITKLNVNF